MVSISRKSLYEKLWSIGTSKTSKELNVPYNKLKSACNSNDIPLPTASYWSSLYMGKNKPIQPLLPNPTNNPEIFIEEIKVKNIEPPKKVSVRSEKKVDTTTNEITSPNNDVPRQLAYFSYFDKNEQFLLTKIYNSLKVNKTLSSMPHKEIVKYRQKKNDNALYYKRAEKLQINSSSGVIIPETLPFIDSLFKALEKADSKIKITYDETQVLYKNYVFSLKFRLPSNKVMLSPDDKEYSSYNTYKYVATGKLNVEIGYRLEWHQWSKHEKLIKQSKNDTFDDLLRKVFIYIFSLPQKIDKKTIAHEIEEEKKRQEEGQKAILKKQHDTEYELTEELLKRSIHYFYSQLVKNYIVSELDETTNEYDWAMNKSNWIKDSDEYPDNILTTKDKEKLIDFEFQKVFKYD
ncbi:hypothetical protein [Virgibacillus sp. SK37]|uniref:hypothetical protein n=1 Tax=Virgibacillus sp. SK37 TaxID=403957 RepID=UPI0004D0E279|nr:hypothetical protein [Virgibacillus sp. SK37]AIF45103.1 hypothetical protein X953_01560 [Virgibacillus sp. SK37]